MAKKASKYLLILAIILVAGFLAWRTSNEMAGAASDDSVIDTNLSVAASISNSCDASVTMGEITGTGQSALTTNDASCTVITNNSAGYALTFSSATTYLENATSDQIAAYSPASAGTPEQWSVAGTASEWGARLKKTGTTTYDSSKWGAAAGTEDYAASDVYWHNVTNASGFTVVSRNSETSGSGDTEIIQFGAEVGSNVIQPVGTYDVDVTVTATTL